jgi:nitrite reductase (NADH) small subunit
VDTFSERRGRQVFIAGRWLGVFRQGESVFVLDGECPHVGGPIGDGVVVDGCAECPWHGWRFRLTDGYNPRNPRMHVATYPVSIDGDYAWVDVPDGPPDGTGAV